MSITLRVVYLVDRLKLNSLFIQEGEKVRWHKMKFSPKKIEKALDSFLHTKGRPYKTNELEKNIIRDLDF